MDTIKVEKKKRKRKRETADSGFAAGCAEILFGSIDLLWLLIRGLGSGIWWILRGIGHLFVFIFEILGEIAGAFFS